MKTAKHLKKTNKIKVKAAMHKKSNGKYQCDVCGDELGKHHFGATYHVMKHRESEFEQKGLTKEESLSEKIYSKYITKNNSDGK